MAEFATVKLRKDGDQVSAIVHVPGAVVAATGNSMKQALELLAGSLRGDEEPFWESVQE